MWSFSDSFLRVIAVVFICALLPSQAIELKTAAQNSAPKYMLSESNVMTGICVDIIQAIEEINDDIRVSGYQRFLPFNRIQVLVEEGELDVFFGFAKNDTRLKMYRFNLTPLYEVNYVVAVRADDGIEPREVPDLAALNAEGTILTVQGTAAARFLSTNEVTNFETAPPDTVSLLRMLLAKRGRFAFYHDLGLAETIRQLDLEDDIRLLNVSYRTYNHYVAFNKETTDATYNHVNEALMAVIKSGRLNEIQKAYGLRPIDYATQN